jgi:membrane associated rhomboid family serine protease
LARPFSDHIGASGLVFGYLGFLIARGVLERSAQAVLLGFVALVLYGGAIWGILPASPRISWESHLFGLLAGIVAARMPLVSRSRGLRAPSPGPGRYR